MQDMALLVLVLRTIDMSNEFTTQYFSIVNIYMYLNDKTNGLNWYWCKDVMLP